MNRRADEISAEIVTLDNSIKAQKLLRAARMERVALLDADICQLEQRKLRLKAELERESAVLCRPQPTGVRLGGMDV